MPLPVSLLQKAAPGSADITICQGDTWYQPFVIKVGGAVVDLTGFTPALKIRDVYGGAVLATATCTIPIGIDGAIIARLVPAVTAALTAPGAQNTQRLAQIGYFDLDITDGTDRATLVAGNVSLSREVTL